MIFRKIREIDWIYQIPVSLVGVEFHGKSAGIASCICGSGLTANGTETNR